MLPKIRLQAGLWGVFLISDWCGSPCGCCHPWAVVLCSVRKQTKPCGASQQAGPLRGLCISSCLHIPALIEFLPWPLSMMNSDGSGSQISTFSPSCFGRGGVSSQQWYAWQCPRCLLLASSGRLPFMVVLEMSMPLECEDFLLYLSPKICFRMPHMSWNSYIPSCPL